MVFNISSNDFLKSCLNDDFTIAFHQSNIIKKLFDQTVA